MGRIHATNLVAGFPNASLYAVADPQIVAIEQAGLMQLPAAVKRCVDYRELLTMDLDAVLIASATATHERVLGEAIAAGMPIFCEKPLAMDLAEAVRLHHAIEERQLPVQVGFMRRFDPLYQRAKQLIENGHIGTPYHFWGQSRDQVAPSLDVARYSGGLCVDTGVHEFDVARWLLDDEIISVFAQGGLFVSRELAEIGDVDQVDISFRTQSGRLGLAELSRNAVYGYDIRAEILGERGAVQVVSGHRTGTVLMVENEIIGDTYHTYAERFEKAYRNELQAFFEAIGTGARCSVTSADAVRAQAAAMAAERSLKSGSVEAVSFAEAIPNSWRHDDV